MQKYTSKLPSAHRLLRNPRLSLPSYLPSTSPKGDQDSVKKLDGLNTYSLWGTPRLFAWDPNVEIEPLSPVSDTESVPSPTSEAGSTNATAGAKPKMTKKIRRTDSMSIEDMKFTNDVLTAIGIEPSAADTTAPEKLDTNKTLAGQEEVEGIQEEEEEVDQTEVVGTQSLDVKGLRKYDSLSKYSNSDFESGEFIVESESTIDPQTSFSSVSDITRNRSDLSEISRNRSDLSDIARNRSDLSVDVVAHEKLQSQGKLEEFCQHFLKGKCRFRDRCRHSHNVINCIYCNELLPVNRVAASAHLHHCWRLNQKNVNTQAIN